MSFVKYSIGGPITSVEDKDGVEEREAVDTMKDQESYLMTCKKCGLQHMVFKGEAERTCFCGFVMRLN